MRVSSRSVVGVCVLVLPALLTSMPLAAWGRSAPAKAKAGAASRPAAASAAPARDDDHGGAEAVAPPAKSPEDGAAAGATQGAGEFRPWVPAEDPSSTVAPRAGDRPAPRRGDAVARPADDRFAPTRGDAEPPPWHHRRTKPVRRGGLLRSVLIWAAVGTVAVLGAFVISNLRARGGSTPHSRYGLGGGGFSF